MLDRLLGYLHREGSHDPKVGMLAILMGVAVSLVNGLAADMSLIPIWQAATPPLLMVVLGVLVIFRCSACPHEDEVSEDGTG